MRDVPRIVMVCALSIAACDGGGDAAGSGGASADGASGASIAGAVTTAGGSSGTGTGGSLGAGAAVGGAPSGGVSGSGTAGSALGGVAGMGSSPAGAGGTGAGTSGASGANDGPAAGASGAAGSSGSGGGVPFGALRITSDTQSIEFTPLLIAAQDFYPGKATVGSGGIPTLLTNPDVDLGSNAETQTLRQSVQHPNARIIFTVTETFYRIVASKSAGIATLADLRGKRVGTIANTSAAFYVDKMLRTVGLTQADVTVVSGGLCMRTPCGANTLPGMLASGNVQAVTLWEPTAELAKRALGEDAIVFQDKAVYREIVNLHTTAEKLADPERRRAIVEFVRALVKAQALYRTQPELVRPRIAEAIQVEEELLEAVWEDERFQGTLVPDLLDVLVEEEAWVASASNRAPRTREELAPLVDDSILREVLGTP